MVLTRNDTPIEGATLVAQEVGDTNSNQPLLPPRTGRATTEAEGQFTLYLSDGDYELEILVPEGAETASFRAGPLTVRGSRENLRIVAPETRVIGGRILVDEATGGANFTVRGYDREEGAAEMPRLRGTTATDGDGVFQLLIANPPRITLP